MNTNCFMVDVSALDSVGKLPSGILEGDYHWWGDYDECRSIFHTYDEMQTSDLPNTFKGQYCLTKLIRLKPVSEMYNIVVSLCYLYSFISLFFTL